MAALVAPLNIARVANTLGSSMKDLGCLCCDVKPYFKFGVYYTAVHPNNASGSTVDVYTLSHKTVDGVEYDSVEQVGTGTQTGNSLTYNSTSYDYESTVYIRQFLINKWSKIKPIKYPKISELTDSEMLGSTEDNRDGYYYGLKVFETGVDYPALHDVTFDYRPPTPDYGYFRLSDFIGYDHEARPNAYATFGKTDINYDVDSWTSVYPVVGSTVNPTGIDIVSIIEDSSNATIDSFYAFVLIGDGTNNYACCLRNQDTGTYTPIYYNDAWVARLEFNLYTLYQQHGFTGGDNIRGTIFLSQGSTLSSGTSLPLDGTWEKVDDRIWAYSGYPMPEGTGITLNVTAYGRKAKMAKITGFTATTSDLIVVYGWVDEAPTVDTNVRVGISVSSGGISGTTATWEGVYSPGNAMELPRFSWSDLGILRVSKGDTYTVSAHYIDTMVDGDVGWTTGQIPMDTEVTVQ